MEVTVLKVVKELKLISVIRTLKEINQSKGFSLVEILVAMTLIVTVFTLLPIGNENPDRERLEDSINIVNRTVRFSVNESILRNVLVRIKFDLETAPIEYSIEYGSGPEIILPTPIDLEKLSYSERKAAEEKAAKFDNQFNPISEFTDGPQVLPEEVELYAVGTSYNPILITSGQASIYFYPSGERDSSLIIFSNSFGLSTLSIAPFEDRTYHQLIPYTKEEFARADGKMDSILETKAKEEFDKWLKD
jgi:prepilin-type N-terminal cleavage/methylation domain-containing protein